MARVAIVTGMGRLAGAVLAAALGPAATPFIDTAREPFQRLPRDAALILGPCPKPKRRFTSRERKGRWPGTLGKLRP